MISSAHGLHIDRLYPGSCPARKNFPVKSFALVIALLITLMLSLLKISFSSKAIPAIGGFYPKGADGHRLFLGPVHGAIHSTRFIAGSLHSNLPAHSDNAVQEFLNIIAVLISFIQACYS